MSASLDFEAYGDAIGAAWTVLGEHARRAGRHAPVPTCPDWTVEDLIAHQGMVHRWAAGQLRGHEVPLDPEVVEAEGRDAADQVAWLDEGAKDLLQALVDAPAESDRRFFLHDAGPYREAWARRQSHETSIHAIDAMAASSGTTPEAESTWLKAAFAADGIDELLAGFLPRSRQRMRTDDVVTVAVRCTDLPRGWRLTIGPDPVRTAVVDPTSPALDADTEWSGTAVALYLGLWNRGEDIVEAGEPLLSRWRERMRITFG